MAIRDISEFRRRAFRTALNVGLGVGVFAVTNLADATPTTLNLTTTQSLTPAHFTTLSIGSSGYGS